MTLPLYRAAARPERRDPEGHAGLWFDKFCDRWRVVEGGWTMSSDRNDNPKLEWIETLTGAREQIDLPKERWKKSALDATGARIGAREQIDGYASRLLRLTTSRGGRAEVFTTTARFVTGLGRSHPVENGFAWHPTLGTPYLAGSSVKGLVRAWATTEAEPRPDAGTLGRLLGSPEKAGTVCFLDAAPIVPVRLEADVMTPHYAGWSAEDPPGDWRSPNPIPFLTTAADTRFLFGILPCRPSSDDDLEVVSGWLRSALENAGGGAKTAVGYGRFTRDDEATRRLNEAAITADRRRREERAREDAMQSPEGRWRLKLQERTEAEILDLVRIHLEKEPLEDPAERRAFVQALLAADLVDHWRRGRTRDSRTGVGKKKLKERAGLIDRVLAEVEPGHKGES